MPPMTSSSRQPVSLLLIALILLSTSSLAQGLSHRSHVAATAGGDSLMVMAQPMAHEMHAMSAVADPELPINHHDDCFCKDLCSLSSVLGIVASLQQPELNPREPTLSTSSLYQSVALEIYLPPPDRQHA